MVVRAGGYLHLEGNTIRDCSRKGVVVCSGGQGTLEGNSILFCCRVGVEVRGEASRRGRGGEGRQGGDGGQLVPLERGGAIAGLLTDETGATQAR